jgi:hypothetical protein
MAADIIQMQNRAFVASMIINGEKAPAFSGNTLMMPKSQHDLTAQIIEFTRQQFTKPRHEVEALIRTSSETTPLPRGAVTQQTATASVPRNAGHPLTHNQLTQNQEKNGNGILAGLINLEIPKKKRKRNRKRKKSDNGVSAS